MPRHLVRRKAALVRLILTALALALVTQTMAMTVGATSALAAGRNLVRDASFSRGASAWGTQGGASLHVAVGHAAHRAIRLRNVSRATATFALDDRPNTVSSTVQGGTYRASAWIRTDSPGLTAAIRLMEHKNRVVPGRHRRDVRLGTTAWTHVSVTYVAKTRQGNIGFVLLARRLPRGKSLFISQPSVVLLPSNSSAHNPSSAPAGYRLVFSDEFNSLDRSKWNVRDNSWANNEESIDTSRPTNVFVANGALTLRARHEAYRVGGTTRQYTSGYLDSIGHGSWRYGRFVMRAKLPAAQGMWPAFWLREDSGLGELDIMEAIGGLPTRTVQTVHQSTNGDMARAGHEDVLPSGTTSAWHTYAVDREPGFVKWYVDGRLVFTKTESDLQWLDSAFNQPMNIRLNLQVGGSMPRYYGKPVNGAPLGASDFVIDYVRVYQRA